MEKQNFTWCPYGMQIFPNYLGNYESAFKSSFKCQLHRIEVIGKQVVMHHRKMTCPDMAQAVCLAQFICPWVTSIYCLSDGNDTLYVYKHGNWDCKRFRQDKCSSFKWQPPTEDDDTDGVVEVES